ncbi:MAG TPA: hypothetical protein VHB98_20065 [Chloroflexota bacterium]|nr:hypothetical protein [Chloroflexota bacterium]
MDTQAPLPLEGPDDRITIKRAAQISGRAPETLRRHAYRGSLHTIQVGRVRMTTRRWLHEYLMPRGETDEHAPPLPPAYVPPE